MKKIFLSLLGLIFAFQPSSTKAEDDFFDNYIWFNFKDHIVDTLELMWKDQEVEFLGEFLVTCIEE